MGGDSNHPVRLGPGPIGVNGTQFVLDNKDGILGINNPIQLWQYFPENTNQKWHQSQSGEQFYIVAREDLCLSVSPKGGVSLTPCGKGDPATQASNTWVIEQNKYLCTQGSSATTSGCISARKPYSNGAEVMISADQANWLPLVYEQIPIYETVSSPGSGPAGAANSTGAGSTGGSSSSTGGSGGGSMDDMESMGSAGTGSGAGSQNGTAGGAAMSSASMPATSASGAPNKPPSGAFAPSSAPAAGGAASAASSAAGVASAAASAVASKPAAAGASASAAGTNSADADADMADSAGSASGDSTGDAAMGGN